MKLKFEYRYWVFSTCGRETKYSRTSLLEPSNRNTCSSLSRSILREIFLAIFSCFFHMNVGILRRDNVKYTCRNQMSTITIIVFSYLCHDSNTEDNDTHTIATIAQIPKLCIVGCRKAARQVFENAVVCVASFWFPLLMILDILSAGLL